MGGRANREFLRTFFPVWQSGSEGSSRYYVLPPGGRVSGGIEFSDATGSRYELGLFRAAARVDCQHA